MPEPTHSKPHLKSAVPQFTVPDVVQTAEYYRDTLGFQIAGYWATPPQFAIVWRDDVEMFFNRANGSSPRTGRARGAYDAYLRVTEIAALTAELQGRGADIIEGPVQRVYGSMELVVHDCNGLVIAFGEDTSQGAT